MVNGSERTLPSHRPTQRGAATYTRVPDSREPFTRGPPAQFAYQSKVPANIPRLNLASQHDISAHAPEARSVPATAASLPSASPGQFLRQVEQPFVVPSVVPSSRALDGALVPGNRLSMGSRSSAVSAGSSVSSNNNAADRSPIVYAIASDIGRPSDVGRPSFYDQSSAPSRSSAMTPIPPSVPNVSAYSTPARAATAAPSGGGQGALGGVRIVQPQQLEASDKVPMLTKTASQAGLRGVRGLAQWFDINTPRPDPTPRPGRIPGRP